MFTCDGVSQSVCRQLLESLLISEEPVDVRSLGTWFGNRRVATSKPQYGECCGGLCLPPTHSYAP